MESSERVLSKYVVCFLFPVFFCFDFMFQRGELDLVFGVGNYPVVKDVHTGDNSYVPGVSRVNKYVLRVLYTEHTKYEYAGTHKTEVLFLFTRDPTFNKYKYYIFNKHLKYTCIEIRLFYFNIHRTNIIFYLQERAVVVPGTRQDIVANNKAMIVFYKCVQYGRGRQQPLGY